MVLHLGFHHFGIKGSSKPESPPQALGDCPPLSPAKCRDRAGRDRERGAWGTGREHRTRDPTERTPCVCGSSRALHRWPPGRRAAGERGCGALGGEVVTRTASVSLRDKSSSQRAGGDPRKKCLSPRAPPGLRSCSAWYPAHRPGREHGTGRGGRAWVRRRTTSLSCRGFFTREQLVSASLSS